MIAFEKQDYAYIANKKHYGHLNFQLKINGIMNQMIEPNWDYFINAPLDEGTQRFDTKTERALHARVVASEANWMQYQTVQRLMAWQQAIHDLCTYRDGRRNTH